MNRFELRRVRWLKRLTVQPADSGVALATAVLVVLALLVFGSTVAVLGVNNLRNASHDRAAGSSLGAGDAGVASAIEYIRANGVYGLVCPDNDPGSCSSFPAGWSNPSSPQLVPLDSAGVGCQTGKNNCAKVWIGVVTAFSPPTVKTGTYNIHSEGVYGLGPSARRVVVSVTVTPDTYPVGVFAQTVSGNGGTAIYTESLFSTDCISPIDTGSGNGTRFTGVDDYWGQPAAGHSTTHVSSAVHCGSNGYIASGSPSATTAATAACPSNAALNGEQSVDGGLVDSSTGSQCYHTYQRADGSWYPDGVCPQGVTSPYGDGLCDTTAFTTADLQRYGYRPRGLSDAEYAALKSRARGEGLYNISVSSVQAALTSVVNSGINDPVLYWDCSNAGSICSSTAPLSLGSSNLPPGVFDHAPTPVGGSCASPMPILTVVVEHADAVFKGGTSTWTDAAFFVPDGSFNANGGYQVLGTMFAKNLSLGGTVAYSLDACWVGSFPGPIMTIKQVNFREDDATDAP
ncbi:MAG TPA: hypothetical protein VFH54_17940 [Mycobacteriales bacterium]|nr:hypothetical protein [Mycobacteriales bacterium]